MVNQHANRFHGAPSRMDDEGYGTSRPEVESDPLAELARLIGQTDPFAGLVQKQSQPARPTSTQEPEEAAPPLPSWMQRVNHRPPAPPAYEPPAETPTEHYHGENASAGYEFEQNHDALPEQSGQEVDPSRYDEALYGAPDDAYQPYNAPQDAYTDPYADPGLYDGAGGETGARSSRRGGMATVAAVLALAFVGTAGAYAYRTWVGAPRSGDVPIIKADAGPNKIVPTAQTADGAGKQIQDRMSTGQGAERIVSREEQPLDVAPPKSGPRVVFPPLTANPDPANAPLVTTQPVRPAPSGSPLGDEPRKVRTVSIRPDQPDSVPQAGPPVVLPQAKPVAVQRTTALPANAPAGNAPMSLAPQGTPPTRVAIANPAGAGPASFNSASGGYVVQIASQRSEADAQASYRALQSKYPSVLGGRTPLIKRADLGEKGVYYRAMVGPFGSSEEASQFCGSLKSAGGQCVVQRN